MAAGWEILLLEEVEAWYLNLDDDTAARIEAAIDALETNGPAQGRPLVDQIKGSRHKNMKELRSGSVRILFVFDPARQAVLLVAGDKRGSWDTWYKTAVPLADDRYDAWREHL
jgi:hypothetical protein